MEVGASRATVNRKSKKTTERGFWERQNLWRQEKEKEKNYRLFCKICTWSPLEELYTVLERLYVTSLQLLK